MLQSKPEPDRASKQQLQRILQAALLKTLPASAVHTPHIVSEELRVLKKRKKKKSVGEVILQSYSPRKESQETGQAGHLQRSLHPFLYHSEGSRRMRAWPAS